MEASGAVVTLEAHDAGAVVTGGRGTPERATATNLVWLPGKSSTSSASTANP